ncbi:MAG TPA: hypothetical protein VFL83_23315 [Anaeromyxobacter sp.]|nr:hypothetical protein [Anaeromyxobacter sp.]
MSGRAPASRQAPAGAGSRGFAEALRRVRDRAAGGARDAAARDAAARAGLARRRSADGEDARLAGRRGAFRDVERAGEAGPAPAAAHRAPSAPPADVAGAAELRAVLRALPVAIEAARVRDGAPLSLSLGRALEVDLRAAAAGVEVVLRPDPRLARAAAAELPALVAALRSRGIAVARAEVRPRAERADAGRRVDVSAPLR